MNKNVICVSVGVFSHALTRGQLYEVIEEDTAKGQIKIRGDNGRVRWYPLYCFAQEGTSAPRLREWCFAESVQDFYNDLVDVSLELDDDTCRWCIVATPDYLKQLLASPRSEPGIWIAHMIIIHDLTHNSVDAMLRYLDQQGYLIQASLPSSLNRLEEFRKQFPILANFLGAWFPDADLEMSDAEVVKAFASINDLATANSFSFR